MSSAVYFKFKASLKQYTIPFEGSAISVKDLRNAIRSSCGLKSTDFELQIIDKQGKEYPKEDDLIPKFSDLIVSRLPKANDPPKKKIANPEDMTRRDPYKAINSLPKINLYSNSINLAKSNIPDDEKLDIMTKRCSEEYSEKNYLVKSKPYGVPPASYVCNKCHQGGHWIHECPGLRDREGKLLDFKSVKRPTGIPQDFLLEVAAGTPGAYLTKEGKYMVPIKDAEAYAMGKKEKRPFSIEENPPYISKDQELPAKLQCILCSQLLDNPTCTPCCSSVFCLKCISDYLYDPEVNGSRKCPSCLTVIDHHESLIENELLRQLIQCWKANMLTKEIVDSCLTTLPNHSSNKKTELNEDSSKSPEMKFNSASEECDSNSSVIKTEAEKVFVNNRRVLKPKISNQMKLDSPNENQCLTPDNSIASPCDNNNIDSCDNNNVPSESIKLENVVKFLNSEKDQDVNDLIFDKVQDFDNQDIKTESTVKSESNLASQNVDSIRSSADKNLKIEIIGKRSDVGSKNSDRKQSYRNDSMKMSHKNGEIPPKVQNLFSSVMNSNTQLLNHFPSSSHLVSSVQQQLLSNTLPLNAIESLTWPIVNPLYSNLNLQTMFGAVNGVAANWMANGLNIPSNLPINHSKRILTKDEFYERQRRLRAEKSKRRYRDDYSRSPSGSQSPRRNHSSKYDDYKYRHSRKKNESSSRYRGKSKDGCKSSRQRDASKTTEHNSHAIDNSTNSSDIKTIDPKLMQESINTFLKYLTANPDDKPKDEPAPSRNSDRRHGHGTKRRATRSRSVPKVSKDRLEVDSARSAVAAIAPTVVPLMAAPIEGKVAVQPIKKTEHSRHKKTESSSIKPKKLVVAIDGVAPVTSADKEAAAAKKLKKSKRRHSERDDDDSGHRKHKSKKHKTKKTKKSKKSKRDR